MGKSETVGIVTGLLEVGMMFAGSERFDAMIIGAGIGGLTCGCKMAKAGLKVLVADGQDEPGGVIRSRRVSGYLLELGPNSFSMSRPEANDVVKELGLESRMQSRVMKDHVRYVWRNRRLSPVPTSLGQFLGTDLLTPGEKVRAVAGLFRRLPPQQDDVEAGAYFRTRLGNGVVEALVHPAVAGIYAADVDNISLEATFPQLFESAQRHGRLIGVLKGLAGPKGTARTPRRLAGFDDGLQALPTALADAIVEAGGEVALGERVLLQQAVAGGDGRWNVTFESGRTAAADHVVIAACAGAAAELLKPFAVEAAQTFASIEYAPLAVVHVGVRDDQFRERRDGFGFLTTRAGGLRLLGMMWNDRVFDRRAPMGMRLVTCFYGGELDPDVMNLSAGEMEEQVRSDLTCAMGFSGEFDLFRVTRWNRAIPLFRVGHAQRIRAAVQSLPDGIRLLGSFMGDPSIPGRMQAGLALASELIEEQAIVPV